MHRTHPACAEPRIWQAQGSDSQLPTDLEAPRTEDRHTEEPVGPHLSWDTHRGTKESVFCRVVGSSSKREAMSLPCGTATRRYLICSPAFLRPTRPWAPWVKPRVRDLPLLPQALKHGEAQGPSPLVQPPTSAPALCSPGHPWSSPLLPPWGPGCRLCSWGFPGQTQMGATGHHSQPRMALGLCPPQGTHPCSQASVTHSEPQMALWLHR